MPSLPPPPPADSWSDEIAAAAEEMMNGVIDVYIPGEPGEYNPITDEIEGGTPDQVIVNASKARIQHLAGPAEAAGSAEWATKRRFRFQIPLQAGDAPITKGMLVRVVDGGRDPGLESYSYTVLSAVNSSHAALRTIEAVTEGAPVDG